MSDTVGLIIFIISCFIASVLIIYYVYLTKSDLKDYDNWYYEKREKQTPVYPTEEDYNEL